MKNNKVNILESLIGDYNMVLSEILNFFSLTNDSVFNTEKVCFANDSYWCMKNRKIAFGSEKFLNDKTGKWTVGNAGFIWRVSDYLKAQNTEGYTAFLCQIVGDKNKITYSTPGTLLILNDEYMVEDVDFRAISRDKTDIGCYP